MEEIDEFDKLVELSQDLSIAYNTIEATKERINRIMNGIDLVGKCIMLDNTDTYKSYVKIISKNDANNKYQEHIGIQIEIFTGEDNIPQYYLRKSNVYIQAHKHFKFIEEEEFNKIFTDVAQKMSNFLEENTL